MMVFSENSFKMAAWLFFFMFFLVYMFNADRVYHGLSGKPYVSKLPDDFPLHVRGDLNMQYVFDPAPVNNKFEEGKGFSGGFASIANKSGNAKVRVFFRSTEALYEVIKNRRSFWVNALNFFALNFLVSTSGLDNGMYQIGIYLLDDDGERFAWMNSFFEKAAGGPVEYIARPVAVAPTGVSKDLNFAIEPIGKDSKNLILQGWAVLDNAEMNDYSAYIEIKDSKNVVEAFYAPLFTRMDIASLYEDIRAANCGFQIKIPQDEFSPGKHVIKVILKSRKTCEVLESVQAETRNF